MIILRLITFCLLLCGTLSAHPDCDRGLRKVAIDLFVSGEYSGPPDGIPRYAARVASIRDSLLALERGEPVSFPFTAAEADPAAGPVWKALTAEGWKVRYVESGGDALVGWLRRDTKTIYLNGDRAKDADLESTFVHECFDAWFSSRMLTENGNFTPEFDSLYAALAERHPALKNTPTGLSRKAQAFVFLRENESYRREYDFYGRLREQTPHTRKRIFDSWTELGEEAMARSLPDYIERKYGVDKDIADALAEDRIPQTFYQP